jgi:hypothetical protein
MAFQLGLMLVLLACVAVYLLLAGEAAGRKRLKPSPASDLHLLMVFLLLATLGVLIAMTPATVPLLAVIQFPWRLLALAAFCMSALGGLVIWLLAWKVKGERDEEGGMLIVALLVCFASLAYSWPQALQPVEPWREDGRAVMEFEQMHPDMIATTRFVDERFTDSPLTAQYLAEEFSLDALERLAVIAGEGEVLRNYSLGHAFGGEVQLATPGTVQIRLYEFPGWQISVDGAAVDHRVSPPHGLMEVDLPAGRHQIDIWMGSTPVRTAGAVTSAATLLALAGLWLYGRMMGRQPPGMAALPGWQNTREK